MYDTCRENDNLSSIVTPKNFVKVTRFKNLSHNEMFTLFCLVEPYEKSQNVIYQCFMSIYQIDNLFSSIFSISDK